MKIVIIVIGTLLALILLVAVIGWSLPVAHRATRQATYAASPAELYELLTNVEQFPRWRSKVKTVERVATPTGAQGFRENDGRNAILYVVDEAVPNEKLVTRIADDKLPFGGMWTYTLSPSGTGTALRITEDGKVFNPIFRFVSKFIISHHATIDGYLTDVSRKLGQTSVITN